MAKKKKQLPQAIESEQIVLGSVLINGNKTLNEVRKILSTNHFFKKEHQIIFDAMIELDNKNNHIDLLTVFDYLKAKDKLLKKIGGGFYLIYLSVLGNLMKRSTQSENLN